MQNIKFIADIRTTGLPFVSITEGTYKGLNFLVDTGSTHSLLYANSVEQYGNELQTEGKYGNVCGLDGKEHKTLRVFGDMIFGGVKSTVYFNLVEDCTSS